MILRSRRSQENVRLKDPYFNHCSWSRWQIKIRNWNSRPFDTGHWYQLVYVEEVAFILHIQKQASNLWCSIIAKTSISEHQIDLAAGEDQFGPDHPEKSSSAKNCTYNDLSALKSPNCTNCIALVTWKASLLRVICNVWGRQSLGDPEGNSTQEWRLVEDVSVGLRQR